jgi:hypothetical protein
MMKSRWQTVGYEDDASELKRMFLKDYATYTEYIQKTGYTMIYKSAFPGFEK